MRVLFYTRNDCFSNTGGDTIQILKTKEYLEKLGITIDFYSESKSQTRNYDIVHVFSFTPVNHVYDFIKNNKNSKLVVSPIYWNMNEYREKVLDKVFVKRKIFNFINSIPFINMITNSKLISRISGINTTAFFKEKLLFCADVPKLLLPNSDAEKQNLEMEFGIKDKIKIIPNGVDISLLPEPIDHLRKKYNLPLDFILCAGRIEYRKNQLELLKAASKIGVKVVLVGKISRQEKKYYNLFQGYDFIHIPGLSQPELFGLFSICKAHVLPSWFETPGLVSLEAAYHGAQIVTTDRGCTKEYFGDYAYYCDPGNNESIKKAILNCFNKPKEMKDFREIINVNYTWEAAAKKTLEAYQSIM